VIISASFYPIGSICTTRFQAQHQIGYVALKTASRNFGWVYIFSQTKRIFPAKALNWSAKDISSEPEKCDCPLRRSAWQQLYPTMRLRFPIEVILVCIRWYAAYPLSYSNHDMAIAPNLLNQQFNPSRPNEVWVTDITYVWTDIRSLCATSAKKCQS